MRPHPSTQRTVTPFLFLGCAPKSLPDVEHVETARDAAEVLTAGRTAVLPSGAWDLAEKALLLIANNEPKSVARQMRFAKTGRLD